MPPKKLKVNVYLEIGDIQVNTRSIIDAVKTSWLNHGKKPSELSDLTIYIKAEDKKAYFVANDCNVTGFVTLSNAIELTDSVYFEKM